MPSPVPIAPRYLTAQIQKDLGDAMVFVSGPRQVGKTTLARSLPGASTGYLNWDIPEDRARILARELPDSPLWVFDEIHKYRHWRNYLKGLYDETRTSARHRSDQKILVTGSGRLDRYRHGGDSLQGRYQLLRLHPFSVAELAPDAPDGLRRLLQRGGFPKPLLAGRAPDARRWSRNYQARLVEEDVRTLEQVRDLGQLQLLMLRLPGLVGSPLSVNALREDLQVSHKTVSSWLDMLERLYFLFRLPPLGGPSIRAVKKEQKHYHFDWAAVANDAARFENLVACHLLKYAQYRQDTEGLDIDLRYFRDTDGREVDFVVTERGRPALLVECAWPDAAVGGALRYLKRKYPEAEAWQVSAAGARDHVDVRREPIRVAPASTLLAALV